ncbi:LIC_13387 family protein [Vulgatibacter incomptus]|uniref:Uncharacterized protein n=1 Tax=Vulgatibacter incomptus TaxID=1391653 RepID=A0A0K1PBB7_9BACT|nr:hypothetical protein [Vulgatibacter incomptus]AKU90419.1 hypothetical protein AKJ08_0806 [Vulgatibacter incomptus]
MKHITWFRAASVLLVLFFTGHTVGGMFSEASMGPEADAVFGSMKTVHFDFNGSDATWYGFWFGFGILTSVFLLFSAFTAWKLDGVKPESWPVVSGIAWALVGSQAANALLSWKYFFAGPGVMATLISALLVVGAVRKQQASARANAPGQAPGLAPQR